MADELVQHITKFYRRAIPGHYEYTLIAPIIPFIEHAFDMFCGALVAYRRSHAVHHSDRVSLCQALLQLYEFTDFNKFKKIYLTYNIDKCYLTVSQLVINKTMIERLRADGMCGTDYVSGVMVDIETDLISWNNVIQHLQHILYKKCECYVYHERNCEYEAIRIIISQDYNKRCFKPALRWALSSEYKKCWNESILQYYNKIHAGHELFRKLMHDNLHEEIIDDIIDLTKIHIDLARLGVFHAFQKD